MRKAVSQITFKHLEAALNEVNEHGGEEAVQEHLLALAYGLGAQLAAMAKPELMPDAVNMLLNRFGQGVESGMLITHGHKSRFEANVIAMAKVTR